MHLPAKGDGWKIYTKLSKGETACEAYEEIMGIVLKLILEQPFNIHWLLYVPCRDSLVGIATGYGLDDQGEREFESR
jgi:hypothetical protein